MQLLKSPFLGVHPSQSIPSRIIIPSDVNKKLSTGPSRQNVPKHFSEGEYQQNIASLDVQNIRKVESEISTTSVQPPMVWFPGKSDCNNQDSGMEQLLHNKTHI